MSVSEVSGETIGVSEVSREVIGVSEVSAEVRSLLNVDAGGGGVYHTGGDGGNLHTFGPGEIGGKLLTIYAGEVINGIQIGNTLCGSRGGDRYGGGLQAQLLMPEDSYIILKESVSRKLDNGPIILSYIHAEIDGRTIKVGSKAPTNSLGYSLREWIVQGGGIKISILGIQSGDCVDAVVFQQIY